MKNIPDLWDFYNLPGALCYYLLGSDFISLEDYSSCSDLVSSAVLEARTRFPLHFNSYSDYLIWLIDYIGGDAPAFSAAFLDELHKLERPSSSLRL